MHGLQKLVAALPKVLARASKALCALVLSNPAQGALLLVNVVLFKSAIRAYNRARFAAAVRVVRDLKSEADIRYLLRQLPPWVTSPEWERGDAVQVLLGLLWPALNTFVCSIIKRELEERVQESSDFGHIRFSRLSFGKHSPAIVGIKAVPLHGEDLLAMVLDVDLRWAGEPDVVLHLTKLGGASLGLSNVQVAGVVRLVFSPITEDPPFLSRMTVSILSRPYIDFSIQALGGPDLMALPAVSSWLHGVILNLLDRVLVWPREIGVRLVPPSQSEEISAEEAFLQPPLGVLVVRVAGAKVEERRSTFLGRLKMPNPRLALIMPQVEGGTVQSGHTPAAQKTREPTWGQQFVFVVAQRGQNLRMLLSHKRMDMLWADMPLGAVEIPLEAVLAEAAPQAPRQPYQTPPRNANANAPYSGAPGPSAPASGGPWEGPSYPRDQARYRRGRSPSPALADVFDGYEDADADGYASATSSPRHSVSSGSGVAWASPVASMAIPEVTSPFSSVDPAQVYPLPSSPRRSLTPAFSGAATSQYWTRPLTPAPSGRADPVSASRGLSVILGDGAKRPSITQTRVISLPRTPSTMQDYQGHWAPPHSAQSMRRRESSLPTPHSVRAARNVTSSGWGASQSGEGEPLWLSPEGVWVEIPASGAVTMAGMVSDAVDAQPPVEPMPSLNAEENKGLLRTLQSLLLGNALGDDDEVEGSDEEAAGGSGTGASAGRIKLVMRWLPVEVARAPVVDLGKRGQQPSVQTTEVTQSKVGEQGPVKDNDRKSSEQQRQPTKKKSGKREARGAPAGGDSTSTGSGSSTPSAAGSAANLADRASGSNNAPAGPSPPVPRAMSVEPLPPKAGVLAIRVAYTKLDYGESPANPILALSLVPNPSASMSSVQAAAAAARDPLRRVITMQCEAGGRPGLLHWGRVFHLVVWDAASVRACLELGDASSSLKLNSYGTELYTMDACTSFEADVTVDARAWIPLKDVVSRGVVRGSWRLREARIVAGGVEMADSDRLDVGRAALLMAWYPFTAETLSSGDGVIA